MSLIIEALEKLERSESDYKEINNLLLGSLKRKTDKSSKRLLLMITTAVSFSVLSAFFVNLYSNKTVSKPQNIPVNNVENVRKSPVIPETIPALKFDISALSINDEDIINMLSEIDFSLLYEIENNQKDDLLSEAKYGGNKKPIKEKKEPLQVEKSKFLSLIWLAEKSYERGNYEKSIKYYEEAYSIEKNEDILSNLITLYIKTGKLDKVTEILDKNKNPNLVYNSVIELTERGLLEDAKKIIYRFLPYDRTGNLFYALGYIYELENNTVKALSNYRKAYSFNPEDQYFAYAYARILEIEGYTEEAEKIFRKLLSMKNLDKEIRAVIQEYYR